MIRIVDGFIKNFTVEDDCPKCGQVIGMELDLVDIAQQEDPWDLEFDCEKCGQAWEYRQFKIVPEWDVRVVPGAEPEPQRKLI